MTPSEALRAAMALIENPARWCQGVLATDRTGRQVVPESSQATRRCAEGALAAVCAKESVFYDAHQLLSEVASANFGLSDFIRVNDKLGHAAVMDCYREAIRRAEAGQ